MILKFPALTGGCGWTPCAPLGRRLAAVPGVTNHPHVLSRLLLCLALLPSLAAAQSKSSSPAPDPQVRQNLVLEGVRTTAYTHTEKDHIKYGARTAAGTALKFGAVRSAAADWSIYPVGTVFQIEGNPALYVVDDYGSALVGTRTIDLYKPSLSYVSRWGVRRVNITILKWGSFAKSLAILKPRENKAPHVRKMVARLEARSA